MTLESATMTVTVNGTPSSRNLGSMTGSRVETAAAIDSLSEDNRCISRVLTDHKIRALSAGHTFEKESPLVGKEVTFCKDKSGRYIPQTSDDITGFAHLDALRIDADLLLLLPPRDVTDWSTRQELNDILFSPWGTLLPKAPDPESIKGGEVKTVFAAFDLTLSDLLSNAKCTLHAEGADSGETFVFSASLDGTLDASSALREKAVGSFPSTTPCEYKHDATITLRGTGELTLNHKRERVLAYSFKGDLKVTERISTSIRQDQDNLIEILVIATLSGSTAVTMQTQ